jgi:hypothetical protein
MRGRAFTPLPSSAFCRRRRRAKATPRTRSTVVEGRAEITSAWRRRGCWACSAHELFGEIALLKATRRRATVTAATGSACCACRPRRSTRRARASRPRGVVPRGRRSRARAEFPAGHAVRVAAAGRTRWLAERVSTQVEAGERIVEQGAPAMPVTLRRYRVEVVLEDEPGAEGRPPATRRGSLFGSAGHRSAAQRLCALSRASC